MGTVVEFGIWRAEKVGSGDEYSGWCRSEETERSEEVLMNFEPFGVHV